MAPGKCKACYVNKRAVSGSGAAWAGWQSAGRFPPHLRHKGGEPWTTGTTAGLFFSVTPLSYPVQLLLKASHALVRTWRSPVA